MASSPRVALARLARTWLVESRSYLALWIYGVGAALVAGRIPEYWWSVDEPWPYPIRETSVTVLLISGQVFLLRTLLGGRSVRTAVWRWAAATLAFGSLAAYAIVHQATDQPGWVYAQWNVVTLATVGLVARTCSEVVRLALVSVARWRDLSGRSRDAV